MRAKRNLQACRHMHARRPTIEYTDALRLKHYSIRTEHSYVDWIRRYILFHHKRHPNETDAADVEAFLTHLAAHEHVAASTQNQALGALLFLYREVLRDEHTFELRNWPEALSCTAN